MSGPLVSSVLSIRTTEEARPNVSDRDLGTAARHLAAFYFADLPHFSWGVARARPRLPMPSLVDERSGAQRETELSLTIFPFLPLIVLGAPSAVGGPSHAALVYPIIGGVLSGRPRSGSLVFEVARAGSDITLAVHVRRFSSRIAGDCSNHLRRVLFAGTQWLIHRLLVARFLRRAARAPERFFQPLESDSVGGRHPLEK